MMAETRPGSTISRQHPGGLNRNQLKYLVTIAMLLDHVGWAFFPLSTPAGQILHFIGRLTGPVMAFFLAEGYQHTRNVRRYALRLGIFALISWIPFSLFELSRWPTSLFGVIYTLFLGLLGLIAWDSGYPRPVRYLILLGLLYLSRYGDWAFYDVVWPFVLYRFRFEPKKKWALFSLFALFAVFDGFRWAGSFARGFYNLGVLAAIPLLAMVYNGQAGSRRPFHKWFFYVFYPVHLFVLYLLRY